MREATYQKDYHIWNGDYADAFEEPLFLHKGQPAVCLRNLFVLQKYRNLKNEYEPETELWTRLRAFVEDESKELLILEGDAGCGKTSLVQALCWHKRAKDEIGRKVLGDRPLVTVRLRELNKKRFTAEDGLLPALLDALKAPVGEMEERKQWLLERFPRAVLVLDGFDELCIIEGIGNYENLLFLLTAERLEDWRFVVTARPGYIRHNIDIPADILELRHFDGEKRSEWIRRYTAPAGCGQSIRTDLAAYIRKGEEEGVCDTPLTLYLLAAGDVGPEERENLWKLYHHLFSERLTKRKHDKKVHPGIQYGTAPYRLAEEMAWRIYRKGSRRLYLRYKEFASIADELWEDPEFRQCLRDENTARSLAERNVGLCCYLKSSEDRGAVEFYHNNIRDFFLAEKLWRELLRVYEDPAPREEKLKALTVFFRDCLRLPLKNRVIEFLFLRAQAGEDGGRLPVLEREQDLCPDLFQHLLGDGRVFDGLNEKRLLPTITAILANAVRCYWALLEPMRREGELHRWWREVKEVNEAGLLRLLFAEIFYGSGIIRTGDFGGFAGVDLCHVNLSGISMHKADLCGANLLGTYLRGANLERADLRGAYLREANLKEAYLEGADLRGADLLEMNLHGANLHGVNLFGANMDSADLNGANLERADLGEANLREADLRGADLRGADLREADLSGADLCKANLYEAYLYEANLNGADLRGADLGGAVLGGADLPDGFRSWENDEQREHLRSLKIPGLKL